MTHDDLSVARLAAEYNHRRNAVRGAVPGSITEDRALNLLAAFEGMVRHYHGAAGLADVRIAARVQRDAAESN